MEDNLDLSTIKKPGTKDRISREEFEKRIIEIAKCKRDICYFASKYFRIITLDAGLTIIKLYPKQEDLLRFFVNEKRCICLASRQTGKCVFKNSKITVRNKENGKISETSIEEFYRLNMANEQIHETAFENCVKTVRHNEIKKANGCTCRKFISSCATDQYEILTDTGWTDCIAVHKTIPYKIWHLVTENHSLLCADDHIVFNENMEEIFVKNLLAGDFIQTKNGTERVMKIIATDVEENMYDVELSVQSNHRYYTDGILSHNTTTYTIYALWTLIFQPETRIMLLANKADTMLEIIDRIRLAYGLLPTWMKPAVVTWNKGEIVFSNRSKIKGFATSSDAARGYSASIVIMDEAAFVPNNIASKVFESIYPVISSSKKSHFIMVSTPNGADPNNLYYNIWQQANQKTQNKNAEGWKAFRFDWFDVPGRDLAWKETTVASIGERRFAQEFGNEFLSGSGSKKLVPDDILERMRMKLSEYKANGFRPKKQKILSKDETKIYEFEMWHEFDPRHTYVASGDISEGVGSDSSVLYIWDVTDLRNITMCAKFSSNQVSLVEFAYVCSKMLPLYGNPWLFAERNGVSAGMLDSLRITYGYQRIAHENKKNEPGVYSHITVKERACLHAREMMTTDGFGFVIYDKDLVDELTTFVKKDTKGGMHTIFQAASGAHDDHVMTMIWMMYALSPDVIDKYFIVCQTFQTSFGETRPRMLQPDEPYSGNTIKEIKNDPLYAEFVEFKHEVLEKCKNAEQTLLKDEQYDPFIYNQQDQYFGGFDDGPSWNFPSQQQQFNPNNRMPAYFI